MSAVGALPGAQAGVRVGAAVLQATSNKASNGANRRAIVGIVCGSVPAHAAKFPIGIAEPGGRGRHSAGMQIASPFVFLGFAAALGLPLFTQAVAIDFATGTFVPSRNAFQVRLGDVVPPSGPAQMVHRSNYTGQATGSLSPTGYYGLVVGFVGTFQ